MRPLFSTAKLHEILQDSYICGDETYQKVRLQAATPSGKKIKKGYIWVFVGMTTGLAYFFYDDGSRSGEGFERQIKGFEELSKATTTQATGISASARWKR